MILGLFTVPTTCSRSSIEMVGCIYFSVDGVLAPPFDIFAQISYVGLLGLSNVHLRIGLLI